MTMQCFLLDTSEGRTRLYISEVSTVQALALLDPHETTTLTDFGAIDAATGAWYDLASLPPLDTVEALAAYLTEQPDLTLVDLSVRVATHTALSTHDDGEATFTLSGDTEAFQLLGRAVPEPRFHVLRTALTANRGHYVVVDASGTQVFPTFDAYLRGA